LLVVPVAVLMARADRGSAVLAAGVLAAAIATDLLDGRAARAAGTAGRRGQIFDHGSDCAFVTAALAGAASREAVPWLLPVLVVVSFVQYVGDSWWLDPSGSLRGNRLGHANGVLYFAPPVIDVLARFVAALAPVTLALAWALVVTTVLSMGQRVRWLRAGRLAPGSRPGGKPDR
jgi:phosphatidylglycerophosphate synthase